MNCKAGGVRLQLRLFGSLFRVAVTGNASSHKCGARSFLRRAISLREANQARVVTS